MAINIRGTSGMSRTKLYVFGFILLLTSSTISYCFKYNIMRNYTASLSVTWGIWLLWDYWLWQFFDGKFGIPKKISGRWQGRLTSSYGVSKLVNIAIKQTFSNIQVEIKTDQVTSHSIFAHWENSSSLFPRLLYIYRTQPLAFSDKDNMSQYGGGLLCLQDKDTMTINYYTSSKTLGKIELKKISSHI